MTVGAAALSTRHKVFGSSLVSRLTWNDAVCRIMRGPKSPIVRKYLSIRGYRAPPICSVVLSIELQGSIPSASSSTFSTSAPCRRMASASCSRTANSEADRSGGALYSIWPPGSKVIEPWFSAEKLGIQYGPPNSSRPNCAAARRAIRSDAAIDTGRRVTRSTGMNSISAPMSRFEFGAKRLLSDDQGIPVPFIHIPHGHAQSSRPENRGQAPPIILIADLRADRLAVPDIDRPGLRNRDTEITSRHEVHLDPPRLGVIEREVFE